MAFFDKIGETISTKSKDVAKKAKDFADTAKLNSQISSEEDIINNEYKNIGKNYFEKNKDDASNLYAEQMKIIADAKQRIEEFRKDIQNIKGVSICPNCGEQVNLGSSFCSGCGSKIEESQSVQSDPIVVAKTCPGCGTVIDDKVIFCENCGKKVQ